MVYPDLLEGDSRPRYGDDEPLIGSPEEIAAAMQGYERLGVARLMFQLTPYGPETLARLAEALAFYRSLPTV